MLLVVDYIECILARKVDASLFIDLGDNDLDLVADVDDILDLADTLGIELSLIHI